MKKMGIEICKECKEYHRPYSRNIVKNCVYCVIQGNGDENCFEPINEENKTEVLP